MDELRFEHHLTAPQGRGHVPADGFAASAGGAACGDLIELRIAVAGDRVADAGFEASGCGSAVAAGSAAVELVRGRALLDAARVGPTEIARELGGLSAGKLHAADLAGDALARALGAAIAARAAADPIPGRVLVAMSGGVDSAVAALLEARAGADVAAVTLELWADRENDGERSCCSAGAVRRARAIAHGLGLPHVTLDLRAEFRAGVVQPYLEAHASGLTPNPCVGCNGHVRIDAMLALAGRLGAAALATGHYARTTGDRDTLLRAAADPGKDQTYMLAALAPASLARMRFPLGELRKSEVRELARAAGLAVAEAPESQDLCFLAGTRRERFLALHGGPRERAGEIVDRGGRVLGRHRGHHGYTVGQRRGLGVGGGTPLYVLATEPAANRVVVGARSELATTAVELRGLRLHRPAASVDRVKLRYRQEPLPARVAGRLGAGRHAHASLELEEPIDGAAPGQIACLLAGDVVVGWGTIARPT